MTRLSGRIATYDDKYFTGHSTKLIFYIKYPDGLIWWWRLEVMAPFLWVRAKSSTEANLWSGSTQTLPGWHYMYVQCTIVHVAYSVFICTMYIVLLKTLHCTCTKLMIIFKVEMIRSEGHLCLPKHFSFNVKEAIQSIVTGNFRWFFR